MSKPIFDLDRNPIQKAFILGSETFSAYIGGVGAGKTFGNIVRNLLILGQPRPEGVYEGPRGLIGAESYPVLDDIVMPQWEKVQNAIKAKAPSSPMRETEFIRSKKRAILKNGARLDFRSLDRPNSLRGRELTTYGIDEGRNVPKLAWDRLFDRLRQPGYRRAGFVTSTPSGYDWQYDLFFPKSGKRGTHPDGTPFRWYNAATSANAHNLPPEYVQALLANLHGLELEQEFYGKFVGLTEGGVFPMWVPEHFLVPLQYNPELPLYTGWDFGIGDPGVVVWLQVTSVIVEVEGNKLWVKKLLILDGREEKDWNAKQWAEYYHTHLYEEYGRRTTTGNYGDPAGLQRSQGSGTSVIDDLASAGVRVTPAQKRPADFGIRILRNMMEGHRVLVNETGGERLSQAFSAHKWHLDKSGQRIGKEPVHDWTSHWVSAVRYPASSLLNFYPRREESKTEETPPPGSIGAVIDSLTKPKPGQWLGPQTESNPVWAPAPLGIPNGV